ncbi:MAG: oxidoreductase, partial [Solirubrobacteraceae bacterium]
LGRRFIAVWWLLPALVAGVALVVLAGKIFIATGAGRSFVNAHGCVRSSPHFQPGVSTWVIVTHAANFFFMVMIVRAGWQILADHPRLYLKVHSTPGREWLRFRGPVPTDRVWTAKDDAIMLSPLFGMPGGRHTIGVARHWHFIFDILFVLNGVVFIVLTFVTDHYLKLVPTQLSILPSAASCLVQYAALHLPAAPGATSASTRCSSSATS